MGVGRGVKRESDSKREEKESFVLHEDDGS